MKRINLRSAGRWVLVATLTGALAMGYAGRVLMGRQPDGSYLVATGQRIQSRVVWFDGRPIDMALDPTGRFLAVLKKDAVILCNRYSIIPGSGARISAGPSFRGCIWSPAGDRVYVSLGNGAIEWFRLGKHKLTFGFRAGQEMPCLIFGGMFLLAPPGGLRKSVPGGMDISHDGLSLFVALANSGSVVEIDTRTGGRLHEWPVQRIPFEVKLSDNEKTLIVSNWGGREPKGDDETADSGAVAIFVDRRGIAASGTVSLIERASGRRKDLAVGQHPCGIATSGSRAWVANAAADSISEIDLEHQRVSRTIPIRWGKRLLFGSMPNALAVKGDRLYVCNGGDNALCEIDLESGGTVGFRPAGFFPVAVALSRLSNTAFVLNTKGNGSVGMPRFPRTHNVHDFQGTISVIDLTTDSANATNRVAANNHWNDQPEDPRPNLAVYHGAVKHVLYIIK